MDLFRASLGHFESFKDVYRNNVMHVRRDYDEHAAANVLAHVRLFMDRLATRISEDTKRQVNWGIK